jgi:hypothetical protein
VSIPPQRARSSDWLQSPVSMTALPSLAETGLGCRGSSVAVAVAEPHLLRLTTAGSVDDGESTLIGRLLHETGAVPEDQLEAIQATSRRRGES